MRPGDVERVRGRDRQRGRRAPADGRAAGTRPQRRVRRRGGRRARARARRRSCSRSPEWDWPTRSIVHADATIALEDAFGDGPGILLIAGTGSVAFGRGPTGTFGRCGGWGPMCGDEGGGAWIGRRALSVVTAAADGREPETALTGAVLTAAEVSAVDDLIGWAASAGPAELASLAPAVLLCAESGDLRANAVVSFAAEELVLHVRTLARRLFADERAACPVAFAGGLLDRRSPLRARVEHRLKSAVPGAVIEPRDVVPARGAVRSALKVLAAQ